MQLEQLELTGGGPIFTYPNNMSFTVNQPEIPASASINRRYTTGFPAFPFNSLSANRKTQIIGGTKET